jgi:tRNA A-37 threonylcarbamoyl transferase component Bud32
MPKADPSSVAPLPAFRLGQSTLTVHAPDGAEKLPWREIAARVLAGCDRSAAAGKTGRGAVFMLPGRELGLCFDVVVRQYRHGGLLRGLRGDGFGNRDRFLEELKVHLRVRELGLPAPEPLGVIVVEGGVAGDGVQGYYATRRLEGVSGLPEYLAGASPGRRRQLAAELGRRLRRLHDEGIFYADLQVRNLLVDDSGELYFIDFDKSTWSAGPLPAARRRANLYRFARSLEKYRRRGGKVSPLDRIIFLQAYEPDPESYRSLFNALARGLGWRSLFYQLGWRLNRS